MLYHPEVANRDCQHCLEWIYEPSGLPAKDKRGNLIRRLASGPSVAPCRDENRGCPKGTPEAKRSLSPQNDRAFRHYLQCKATGRFPDDPIVRENAGIIRGIEDEFARYEQRKLSGLLEGFITAMAGKAAGG